MILIIAQLSSATCAKARMMSSRWAGAGRHPGVSSLLVPKRWRHCTRAQHAFSCAKVCFASMFHLQIDEMKSRALCVNERRVGDLGRAELGKSHLALVAAQWLPWIMRKSSRQSRGEACTTGRCLLGRLLVPSRTSLHSSHIPTFYLATYTRVFALVVALLCCHPIPPEPANPCLPRVTKPRHRH